MTQLQVMIINCNYFLSLGKWLVWRAYEITLNALVTCQHVQHLLDENDIVCSRPVMAKEYAKDKALDMMQSLKQ